jgi:hypothetical protein
MKQIIAEKVPAGTSLLSSEKTYIPIVISPDNSSFTIHNNGTAAAPCAVTVIPDNDIMRLEIAGLTDEPVIVDALMRGDTLIIDGVRRRITINGVDAYDKYNGWEFPKIKPGKNEIKITNASAMLINIEYQPRYI